MKKMEYKKLKRKTSRSNCMRNGGGVCPFCWGVGFITDEDTGSSMICPGCQGTGRQN